MPNESPLLPGPDDHQPSFRQSNGLSKWNLGRLVLIITVATTALLALAVLVLVATSISKAPPEVNVKFVDNARSEVIIKEGGRPPVPPPPPPPTLPPSSSCHVRRDRERFDCIPEGNATEFTCMVRRCCWRPDDRGVPSCYFPSDYQHYRFTRHESTPCGSSSYLTRDDTSGFPNDIRNLRLDVFYVSPHVLRIKIYDPNNARYEVPFPEISHTTSGGVDNNTYIVEFGQDSAFFTVKRKGKKGAQLFDTSIAPLVFSDQFIELSTRLPSRFLYGLGEHMDQLLRGLEPRKYHFFNRGDLPTGDPEQNLYGHHPFYLIMEEDGRSHGVFLLNSNAMDILVHKSQALTYRTIGGILDFYFFMGPTPDEVVQQYTGLVGKPFLPPYWSLGFHLCRWGFGSTNVTRQTYERNVNAGILLEVMWNDIDYMDNFKDFTIDPVNYIDLPDFVNELHTQNRHYVLMLDPGLSVNEPGDTYPPYDEAKKLDLLIKDADGKILIDQVWTKYTAYPDYTHPEFPDYWREQFKRFQNQIQFDGAWIDMNEPDCFVDGSYKGCPMHDPLESPPYVPGKDPLQRSTICMTAKHNFSAHYNLHNLFGALETKGTYYALKAARKERRPFIISRSTAPGQGHFGGHWTGDIRSSWEHMRLTVPAIMNFNMYGIPMVGSDICGFAGNATEELCIRWSQLGAFYPFSRNHNADDTIEQDPAAWGPEVAGIIKIALMQRYYLLPYLYTLFAESSSSGSPVVRPLFFEFPQDRRTYGIDTQFLWGPAFMILPALWPGQFTMTAYFPKGVWYDVYTSQPLKSNGEFVWLPAPLQRINLFLRGGYILPAQPPSPTIEQSRRNMFELQIALDESGNAMGHLVWDDGDTLSNKFTKIQFQTANSTLTNTVVVNDYAVDMPLGRAIVVGIRKKPSAVYVNKMKLPTDKWNYNPLQVLEIGIVGSCLSPDTTGKCVSLNTHFTITWSWT